MTLNLQSIKSTVTAPEEQEQEVWTDAKLKDEFFSDLTKVPNTEIFYLDRKYYSLAKELMYRIPVYRPPPALIFNISDLSPKCKQEFIEFVSLNSEKEIILFLKQIAVKFFENINPDYTHISVIKLLKVGYTE